MITLDGSRLKIDPFAVIIPEDNIREEVDKCMNASIGSTQSGTGAAVVNRIKRDGTVRFAKDIELLSKYLTDTKKYLRNKLDKGCSIVVEGTQGFGLSVLHSEEYPYVTARDTTAAGVLSEIGLSPFDVAHIILVIRAYPIRVAGNSGKLKNEVDWEFVTSNSGSSEKIEEFTSVTKRVRRVAEFAPEIAKRAISVNDPDIIVMNHLDYIDSTASGGELSQKALSFVEGVEYSIGHHIDLFGINATDFLERRKN